MPLRTDLIQIGSRVSYEDMANPRREGRVTEIIESEWATQYRVAWDAGSQWAHEADGEPITGTVSDLRQHGWHMLAEMPGNIFDGADIISVYTLEDAVNDGQLTPALDLVKDEPEFVQQAGWAVPVYLTAAVANIVIPTEREAHDRCQDVKGRLWDLLHMAAMYGRGQDTNTIVFPTIFQLAGPDRVSAGLIKRNAQAKTMHFKAVIGPGTSGEPICTIMLRNES